MFEVKVPAVGESVQEGEVYKWHKSEGEHVAIDDVLVEIETDKATVEIVAEAGGKLSIVAQEGDTVNVGDLLAKIDTAAKGSGGKASDESASSSKSEKSKRSDTPKSASDPIMSPAAQRVVTENNVDPRTIEGSGRGGRITKEDAVSAAGSSSNSDSASTKPVTTTQKDTSDAVAPSQPGSRGVRKEKMSRLRRTIANRLVSAQHEAAMLTTFNEVDMTEVIAVRKRYKEMFKDRYQVGLGFMSFFVKACVFAIQEFPRINASIVDEEIHYHDYCDIGIAVSTERGLMVPIVRNCEDMAFNQIESSILNYAKKGRDGKISPDDLVGGTFTITNGGVFGSLMSTPILTPPQSAILGMHKIQERAMVVDGEVKVRPMMYLAMTYDHRIVDGKEAVGFLVKVKECLEDPTRLLIGV